MSVTSRKQSRSVSHLAAVGLAIVTFSVTLPMDLAAAAPTQASSSRLVSAPTGRLMPAAVRPARRLVARAAPSFGALSISVNGGKVSSSYTLTSKKATTFTRVQTAVRPAATAGSNNGSLDFGSFANVTVHGTRTFSAATTALAPGDYVAFPGYLLNGVWTSGTSRVAFTVPAPTTTPTASPTASPSPSPVATAAPTTTTSPTPTAAPSTTTSTRAPIGTVAGFSPGGAFPFLSDAALARDLDGMAAAGAGWVRVDFPWTVVEPSRGNFDWSRLDRVTAAAAARGIKVLALPAYTPTWARPAGCVTDKCPPADPADFARFVAAAGSRYGSDRVQGWELWNEPNIPSFWSPRPDVDAYATLLARSAAALRAARPEAFILSAGLSPAYSDGTNVAPVDFVKRLYALGVMRDVDAVAVHPYSDKYLPLTPNTESWNTFLQMKTIHDVMVGHGDGAKKVWGTEFGVATGTSSNSTTETQQAAIIKQGYERLSDGTWPWFGGLLAYSLRDSADNISDWQSNYGLQRFDSSPKPAFTAFTDAMRLPLVR